MSMCKLFLLFFHMNYVKRGNKGLAAQPDHVIAQPDHVIAQPRDVLIS